MDFNSIIGQKEIVESLKNAIRKDKVSHAYLFTGNRGIGKRTVARIFARLLLCEKGDAEKSCNMCLPCRMLDSKANPDFYEIGPVDEVISIEEVRKIQSDAIIRPLYSTRKVYLICDADAMTMQAQNCLLKKLEEPPEHVILILTASNADALLETIRSRTLKYDFKKNMPEEVGAYLESKLGKGMKGMDFVISYSEGVIGTALELADSDKFILMREKTIEIILQLLDCNLSSIFDTYSFFEANKDHVQAVLDIMLLFYRDLLVYKECGKEKILINSDKKVMILNKVSSYSSRKLMENIEIIELTRKNIKQNANYQLSIEVMLMKLQEADGSW